MSRPRAPLTDLRTYPHKFVRLSALSEYVDVPMRTIYYHIEKGALHAVKIGGTLRVPIESAREYAGLSPERH